MAPPIRYRKGELIGCGAFGRVYMGMNLDSGELLAVKQVLVTGNAASMARTQDHIREIEEEVKLLKNLSHPNIVRYLGTVRDEDTLNILLEFVPGGSISSLLGKFGPFPEAVIRTYTKQLLLGLDYLHSNGIMHRDIKGANILVDNQGCIKLADFGASKQVVELATVSGAKSMKGTPYWMAPEVILQTGHSFSADIWSVGCTVIEMATGKAPWSQQYKEVAALFYIGSTKSHPEIPEHLSADAKDFLLKCLDKEPNRRPSASDLLQHPFVTVPHRISNTGSTIDMENRKDCLHPEISNSSNFEFSSVSGTSDVHGLGSLRSSINTKGMFETKDAWGANISDDEMCLIDEDDFSTTNEKDGTGPLPFEFDQSELDESANQEQQGRHAEADNAAQGNDSPFSCGASFSEDDELLAESKIRAFLEEKALELKKLQTPLFEEFYSSMNAASFCTSLCNGTPPNYLKLPPKSRSPNQAPLGTPSVVDAESPGNNSCGILHIRNLPEQLQDSSFSQLNDQNGLPVDSQSGSITPSINVSERQKKWKEELAEELERQREMMRQAGMGSRTSSPKDRALSKPRERTKFASPSK